MGMEKTGWNGLTRRSAIIGCAVAFGAIATARGATAPAGISSNAFAIHQEEFFPVEPKRIFDALLDARQFTKMTGRPAIIDPTVGGTFSLFNGVITGRTLELVPNALIVQAWRDKVWPQGFFTIVRFELKAKGAGTLLVFDHTGLPQEAAEADSLALGWPAHYWKPLLDLLGG
jgi:activator of HSP90 ATPase